MVTIDFEIEEGKLSVVAVSNMAYLDYTCCREEVDQSWDEQIEGTACLQNRGCNQEVQYRQDFESEQLLTALVESHLMVLMVSVESD